MKAPDSGLKIIKTSSDLIRLRHNLSGSVGFVPTMGYLHQGHISLIERAKKENTVVVVSIYVNPKQFGPNEDLANYPRNLKRDLQLLKEANADIVFIPSTDEIYPKGYETYISVSNLAKKLEGKSRPDHFTGVATIILKLFQIIRPDKAYFGQKDAQQVVIMKRMVSDLCLSVAIVVGKTIREPDGLAMSSRNAFLGKKERKQAVILYKSLTLAREMFNKGETDPQQIKYAMEKLVRTANCDIDYISIANPETLEEVKTVKKNAIVSLAAFFGKIRLIDNMIIH